MLTLSLGGLFVFQLELLALNIYLAVAAHGKQRFKWPCTFGLGEGIVIRLPAFLAYLHKQRKEDVRKNSLFQGQWIQLWIWGSVGSIKNAVLENCLLLVGSCDSSGPCFSGAR